ncbi:MAG TPA: FecR domain-containing protein [Longimicrobiales bacterium]|nr:FecR domain-containing protein [Longimicrobiales bacterium]
MRINRIIILSLRNEASVRELRELEAWRGASADNERHYRELVRVWELTAGGDDGIVVAPPPGVEEIVASGGAPAPVQLLPPARLGPRPPSWLRSHWIRYAAVGAAAIGIWMLSRDWTSTGGSGIGEDRFVTGRAGAATVSLKDGTVVRVAPGSSLSIPEGADAERRVGLEGRAFFAVAHDESHPFHIRTAAGDVTVLGTRFDLQARDASLSVIVLEGTVSLSADGHRARVRAGEMGRILEGTLLPPVRVPDPVAAMAWRGRFLAFQDTPLDEVAREIAREYGVPVLIADTALAHRTVTGWFADRELDDVLRIACAAAAVRCVRQDGIVTITSLRAGRLPDVWRSTD